MLSSAQVASILRHVERSCLCCPRSNPLRWSCQKGCSSTAPPPPLSFPTATMVPLSMAASLCGRCVGQAWRKNGGATSSVWPHAGSPGRLCHI